VIVKKYANQAAAAKTPLADLSENLAYHTPAHRLETFNNRELCKRCDSIAQSAASRHPALHTAARGAVRVRET